MGLKRVRSVADAARYNVGFRVVCPCGNGRLVPARQLLGRIDGGRPIESLKFACTHCGNRRCEVTLAPQSQ